MTQFLASASSCDPSFHRVLLSRVRHARSPPMGSRFVSFGGFFAGRLCASFSPRHPPASQVHVSQRACDPGPAMARRGNQVHSRWSVAAPLSLPPPAPPSSFLLVSLLLLQLADVFRFGCQPSNHATYIHPAFDCTFHSVHQHDRAPTLATTLTMTTINNKFPPIRNGHNQQQVYR